jgi:putative oxidoreductase
MQRLFSTFPNSLPGLGLLNLRATAAFCLLFQDAGVVEALTTGSDPISILRCASIIMGAVSLLAGLLTPVVSIALLLVELWQILLGTPYGVDHAILAALALSISTLGPGAWSLDARLYGRKRIQIER